MGPQIHTGSYVLLPSERDSQCYPECMLCSNWANILCAGSCIFHIQTDTRTNKQHSLLTCVGLYLLPPVSFYLKGLVPELLPLLCLTSKLLSFGMCTPNYRHKKHFGLPSRGTGSVPVENFHKVLCLTHRGGECLLTSFFLSYLMERCWFLFGNPLFFSRTGSNPVETSGDDSGCISDTHHMWFIILRLACPGQIGLCIFSDSPIHIHGTRLWWHIGSMKVFPVFVSWFKGVDGYLHWWCDTGSTLGQSSPPSPAPQAPSPPVTLLPPLPPTTLGSINSLSAN